MSSIWEQEESLFAEWIKHEEWIHREDWTGMSDYPVEKVFCPDGLHYTGSPSEPHYNEDGSSYRVMMGDDKQEELWSSAYLKPVFLCKDYNGKNDDGKYGQMDAREETGYSNERLYYRFYARYLRLLYGITNYDFKNNAFPEFEEADNQENFWLEEKGFFHAPVVRMNLKKIAGGNKCEDWLLKEYIKHDKEFLTRQKDIYEGANLFICCHGGDSNPILGLVKNEWFPDLEMFKPSNGYIWYSPSKRVVVVDEYHMSARFISYSKYYQAISYLKKFLDVHKGFLD